MQPDRTANQARLDSTVRGLGVCDVLRIELAPAHRPDLEAALAARANSARHRVVDLEHGGAGGATQVTSLSCARFCRCCRGSNKKSHANPGSR